MKFSTYHKLAPALATMLVLFVLSSGPVAAADSTTRELGIRDKTPNIVALKNARLVVSPSRVLDNGTLLVRDERIVEVGADVQVPPGAVVHDLTGRTVLPGFIEPYGEYGLSSVGPLNVREDRDDVVYEARRRGPDAWNEAIHAERRWVEDFSPNADEAKSLLQRGVTAVHSSKMDGIFRGQGFVALLSDGLANDVVLEPEGLHSASFHKGSSQQPYPNSLMGSIALIRQTLLDAKWYADSRRLGEETEVNLSLGALADNDRPMIFDASDELSLLRASRISNEMKVPFLYVGSNEEYLHLDAIRAIQPTILLPLGFPETPEVGSFGAALDISLSQLRHWERAASNPSVLAAAELRFAWTGQKLGDGDFLGNLRKAVERGLTPGTALAGLTTIPANILGISSEVGTLEPGKLANLVIAEGDLFSEDQAILQVWVAGRPALINEPLHTADASGLYDLVVDGNDYRLNLNRDSGELAGSLAQGDDKAVLTGVTEFASGITFRSPWGTPEDGGVARFDFTNVGDTWRGNVTLPDGTSQSVLLGAVTEEPESSDAMELPPEDYIGVDEPEQETAEVLVSHLTQPPLAFGFEELPRSEAVFVTGATVWTSQGDAAPCTDCSLHVAEGKIIAVGPGLSAPAGVRVIDATGKHVTAGIIDEHSHIAISQGVNEGSHNVTAEVRIGDVVNPDHIGIYRALGGGVTTIQQLHGSANPIGGQAQIIKLRWGHSSEDLKFQGAPPSIKFALGENVKQSNWGDDYNVRYPQTRMGVETIMRDAFVAAREYAAAHDAYESLSSKEKSKTAAPRRDLQMEALVEILDAVRFIHCHSYVQSEILMLMRLADELGFKVQTFTHILEGYKVADEMADHGVGGSTFSDWWAYKFEVNDAIPHNTCILNDAGVVTSVNSDSGETMRRLNQEAAKSITYCGMSETDALAMVTINPAKQLKIDGRVGSLAPGKDGDFVIWDGHPLSIYSKAEQTWIDGTLYFSRERDVELRERDRAERAALIQKILADEAPKPESGEAEETTADGNDDPTPEATQEWHCDSTAEVR